MFTDDKEAAASGGLGEKSSGTNMAIGNPQIVSFDGLEHRAKQRALLRMAIFTRQDIGDQSLGGLRDHHRFPWPGPRRGLAQCVDAMRTGFETVAIDDLDPIACEPRCPLTAHVLDEWDKLTSAIAYQLSRCMCR